jgi:hypothetical protein
MVTSVLLVGVVQKGSGRKGRGGLQSRHRRGRGSGLACAAKGLGQKASSKGEGQ